MGFFEDIGNIIRAPVDLIIPPSKGSGGGHLNEVIKQHQETPDEIARKNERLREKELREGLQNQAKEFRRDLPGFIRDQQHAFKAMRLRELAKQQQVAKENLASRGLLLGGYGQGKRALLNSMAAGDLASANAEIRKGAGETADLLEAEAIGAGATARKKTQDLYDSIYNRAIGQYRQRYEDIGAGMEDIGRGAGTIIGMEKDKQK